MHFLDDLMIILGVSAIFTVVFQKLRQPLVLGYILAGLAVGEHTPGVRVHDEALVHALSELGVILLMFSIGIEFSIRKIARVGLTAGLTALLEVGLMISLGYLVGQLFGWTAMESLFAGACLGISSTMLVAKAFEEKKLKDGFTEVVFAVLVFEDMIAILLLAILTAVASGSGMSPYDFAITVGKLLGFLGVLLVGGLLIVPRLLRLVAALGQPETLLVASVSVCFAMAVLAEKAGYSVALGAFLGGLLISESGQGHKVEHELRPLRDVFAAIFFVSVGMTIDPGLVAENWLPVVVLTAVVLAGKTAGVSLGSFLTGSSLRTSVRSGMSLAQIGEFSFIIATLGMTTGAVRDFLFPVAVAVSCITAFTTPRLVAASERVAGRVDHALPARLQTFVTFYASWIEQLRNAPRQRTLRSRVRGQVLWILGDAALLIATVAATARFVDRLAAALSQTTGLDHGILWWSIAGVGAALAGGFAVGLVRHIHQLALTLASEVMPRGEAGKADTGTAPRRALVVTLELAMTLIVGLPLVALLQPCLFVGTGALVIVLITVYTASLVWRSVTSLQGHVRAGTELLVEVLARQTQAAAAPAIEATRVQLPGFPKMSPIRLSPTSAAVGRTLAQLDLRALTGASVLAISRAGAGVVMPTAGEVLREGDILALAGSQEAVAAAMELLGGAGMSEESGYLAFNPGDLRTMS